MATTLTATSCFDRGDYVRLNESITWGDFKITAIQAVTNNGIPTIRVRAELQRADGTTLECTISNLRDEDLKKIQHVIQHGKQLTSKDFEII